MRNEQRTAVVNASVVHTDRVGFGECVFLSDGIIEYVGEHRRPPADWEVIDVGGRLVLPGLVDIHAHGALGHTFNEASAHAWRTVTAAHAAAGSTTLLATLATDSLPAMMAALAVGRRRWAGDRPIGAHLEGPYLNPAFRGAHPRDALRVPDDHSWRELLAEPGFVRMVTLAPELPGAEDMIWALAQRSVAVSAGHSAASAEVMAAAHADGLRHVAHLWSGQSMLCKDGPWRATGLLESVLSSTEFTAELIADGRHLSADLVRIAYRCLGPDRLCLVSDASAGTGLPRGTEFAMGAVRGVVADGVALDHTGGSFCGSTSFLSDILRFTVLRAGVPLVDATRMAATTPALVLGIADRVGSLRPGLAADLVVLDDSLRVLRVARGGQWLYEEPDGSRDMGEEEADG
ncbi:N-acetylglucosamine-6-phosphate deacetylase [Streptomyces formicae]|uniref:Amidohydrolase family protein n=1 Tax=Streptomyces formicae TaxID=1616117 RepID=A0ABY3WNL6_9ACTN|nr:amidohydrolase family protein [Streptomyces formicae]UNM13059.1 amidohydrolase family protein [Streptomyces formicae]